MAVTSVIPEPTHIVIIEALLVRTYFEAAIVDIDCRIVVRKQGVRIDIRTYKISPGNIHHSITKGSDYLPTAERECTAGNVEFGATLRIGVDKGATRHIEQRLIERAHFRSYDAAALNLDDRGVTSFEAIDLGA